jgi:hypothetical protein
MEMLRRRHRRAGPEDAWIAPLAGALQSAQIIYLIGSCFVGIAFQPFVLALVGVQIGFDTLITRRDRGAARKPWRAAASPATESAA